MAEEMLAEQGIGKILTLTSTYDHRVIQGAQSGEFLRRIHELLLGGDDFYGDIFRSLSIPYEPIQWARDISASHETDLDKTVRVQEVIHAFRVRGHLMADTNPLVWGGSVLAARAARRLAHDPRGRAGLRGRPRAGRAPFARRRRRRAAAGRPRRQRSRLAHAHSFARR